MLHANLILQENISIEAWYACRWYRISVSDGYIAFSILFSLALHEASGRKRWPEPRKLITFEANGNIVAKKKGNTRACIEDYGEILRWITYLSIPRPYHGIEAFSLSTPRECEICNSKRARQSKMPQERKGPPWLFITRVYTEIIRKSNATKCTVACKLARHEMTGESSPLLNHCPQSSFHSRPSCVTLCGHLPSRVKMQTHHKTCAS